MGPDHCLNQNLSKNNWIKPLECVMKNIPVPLNISNSLTCWYDIIVYRQPLIRIFASGGVGLLQRISPWAKWPPFRRRHFQMHFREWNFCILIKSSLKFVPKGPVDNNPSLVQIMAWRRIDGNPLSEPILTRFTTYAALGGDELTEFGGDQLKSGYWSVTTYSVFCVMSTLNITVTSHELHGVSNHRPFACLFNICWG